MNQHAATMDKLYGWQRGIYDLTRKYYLLKRDQLIIDLQPPRGGTVLEVGCGTGRNLIKAARLYPDCDFYGIDISTAMLEVARDAIFNACLSDRVRVGMADATDLDIPKVFGPLLRDQCFDRVFMSYTLSMIPDWQRALACAADQVKPGGALMVVDFGSMQDLPLWFKTAMLGWLGHFHTLPRQDLETVMGNVCRSKGFVIDCSHPLGGYSFYGTARKS